MPEQVRASLARSLVHLRTGYLDSFLLHGPLPTPEATLTAWNALARALEDGLVRSIGVSNVYDVESLRALGAAARVEVVQNRWYEGNSWCRDVWQYCETEGIMFQCVFVLTVRRLTSPRAGPSGR